MLIVVRGTNSPQIIWQNLSSKTLNVLVQEILGSDGVDEKLRPAATFLLDREKEESAPPGGQFHPDGFVVASGGSRTGGHLWFWTPQEETVFHTLKFQQRAPSSDVALAPDYKTLAIGNHDGAIGLYKMQEDQPTKPQ